VFFVTTRRDSTAALPLLLRPFECLNVYHIHFTASDFEGSSSGVVKVAVPHNMKKVAVDDGALFNSTE